MASYNPPSESLDVFNKSVFTSTSDNITQSYADTHYLKYPTSQTGTETITSLVVSNDLTSTNDATINGLSVGRGAGSVATNTVLGKNALSVSGGNNNTAIGTDSVINGGVRAIGIGFEALYNGGSVDCVAIGYKSLHENPGANNTGIGNQALNAVNTGGSCNTALGYQAGQSNTSGSNNTYIGYQAGSAGTAITTGSNNTFIGYQAQSSGTNINNSTAVGIGAIATASNQVVLGRSSETVVIPNQINYSYTSNPTLSVGSIGYNYQYSFSTASVASGATRTLVSFTNTPVGIYFCFVNLTVFDVNATSRIDITITTGTNITFLNSTSGVEMGGNAIGKLGFNNIYPIKITSATNQLTIILNNVSGPACQLTGGVSNLMRIA
jgi:hypothetical protein